MGRLLLLLVGVLVLAVSAMATPDPFDLSGGVTALGTGLIEKVGTNWVAIVGVAAVLIFLRLVVSILLAFAQNKRDIDSWNS